MKQKNQPLLTIAIPTFNRAEYLRMTLIQLKSELNKIDDLEIEIIVSNNASIDCTAEVVVELMSQGLNIRYLSNEVNLGVDANIAKCFDSASGFYVLILGDDDLFVDGGLVALMGHLEKKMYSLICMRAYGYNEDFRAEFPGRQGKDIVFDSQVQFLGSIGQFITLISSMVINKNLIKDMNANSLCGSYLVQVELIITALIRSNQYLYINRYLMACKRNNTGGYAFFEVFVKNLAVILDKYKSLGLLPSASHALEEKMLLTHFPLYIYRLLKTKDSKSINQSYMILKDRFSRNLSFKFFIQPAFLIPNYAGQILILFMVFWGRIVGGDLIRGIWFLVNVIRRFKILIKK